MKIKLEIDVESLIERAIRIEEDMETLLNKEIFDSIKREVVSLIVNQINIKKIKDHVLSLGREKVEKKFFEYCTDIETQWDGELLNRLSKIVLKKSNDQLVSMLFHTFKNDQVFIDQIANRIVDNYPTHEIAKKSRRITSDRKPIAIQMKLLDYPTLRELATLSLKNSGTILLLSSLNNGFAVYHFDSRLSHEDEIDAESYEVLVSSSSFLERIQNSLEDKP